MRNHRRYPWIVLLGLFTLPAWAPAMELEHERSRQLVDFVTRAAELFEQQGAAACDEFKREGGDWLRGDSYIFVIGMDGKALCHPARPTLEGRDLSELRDPDGKPIMKLMLRQLERGGSDGWVHYLWPRPGKTILTWKSTYVRRAAAPGGTAMVVGAGAYNLEMEKAFVVDRVAEAAALLESEGRAAFEVLRDKAAGFIFLEAYVFVMDMKGVELVNPAFPDLEGRNILDIKDDYGVHPAQEMVDLLKNEDEGWVGYQWPRPGDKRPSHKETFVRKVMVAGEELVVGAGVYHD